jgi:hypothetical protein
LPKKPHVKVLREVIAKKLNIKTSQIYKKAKDLAISVQAETEDGIYLLAAKTGISLNRYLPKEKVDKVRDFLFRLNQQSQTSRPESPRKKPADKMFNLRVGKAFKVTDPLLPNKVLAEAKEMAEEVYPLLYVFENSVREMIIRIMQSAHGFNWWDTNVPKDIRQEVERRKAKEDQNPWHGKRGAYAIYYSDLEHLGRIVQNNWADFKAILPTIQWLTQRIDEISHSRNPVAHMNPLSKDDIQRIKVYFSDWEKQIRSKRTLIP